MPKTPLILAGYLMASFFFGCWVGAVWGILRTHQIHERMAAETRKVISSASEAAQRELCRKQGGR
jgi:hypothetical protein